MKRLTKLFSIVMVVFMLLTFSACDNSGNGSANNGEVIMSVDDFTLTESEYMYLASYVKDMVVYNQQNYIYQYTGTVYEEADILAMPVDDDTTVADYIKDYSVELAQQLLIMEKLCADSGIEITNQEDLDTISNYLADIEYAYGGIDLFEVALARLGFARSGIERFQRFSVLYELLYDYRYGESGIARVSSESVNRYFTENYIQYDGAVYSYLNSEDGTAIVFDYSEDEIAEYFDENYVKVRHILYKTVDSSNVALSDEEKAEKKQKADAALASVQNGEKTLDDLKNETEDSGYEYTFTYGEMVDAFETASFEMEVGEVRLVETEYGYHLIEKLAKTDEDLNGTPDEDGELIGGIKSDVAATMSAAKIREEALATLEKLNSGELEKYPEENTDANYYLHMDSGFIDKNDSNYQALVSIIADLEKGVYVEQEFPGDATYILRNIAFTSENITSDIYTTIEESLAVEAFAEYTQAFYDSVETNNELLEKIDILTLPMLEEEFYTE